MATVLLTAIERFQLASWMQLGALDPDDVRTKLDIIMAERHCGSDEAFKIMSKLSQDSNRKLRDIATALVDGARRP